MKHGRLARLKARDVGEGKEGLENELCRRWSNGKVGEWTAHSPTLPSLYLCHSSFSNPSFASPTSQAVHLIHLASRPCFDHTRIWRASPYEGSAQCRSRTWKTMHTIHTSIISNKANKKMIFGGIVDLKLPDICLISEEKPRKNFTKETCPGRGSNPGPLRDRRACYYLFHSGAHKFDIAFRNVYKYVGWLFQLNNLQYIFWWSFDKSCVRLRKKFKSALPRQT